MELISFIGTKDSFINGSKFSKLNLKGFERAK